MKKLKLLFIALILTLTYSQSYAIFGAGLLGGIEVSTIDSTETTLDFIDMGINAHLKNKDGDSLELGKITASHAKISGPIMFFGGQTFIEIPVLPLSIYLSGTFAATKYTTTYHLYTGLSDISHDIVVDNIPYSKIDVVASARYTIFDSPIIPIKPYVGACFGVQYNTPFLTNKSLYEDGSTTDMFSTLYQLSEDGSSADYNDLIDVAKTVIDKIGSSSRTVYGVDVGVKIKFPLIPIAIHGNYRLLKGGELNELPTLMQKISVAASFNI